MKRLLGFILICSLMLSFVGCGRGNGDYDSKIYYVNTDKTSINGVHYKFTSNEVQGKIKEAIEMLKADTDDIDYITTIPAGLELKRWTLNDGTLELFFVVLRILHYPFRQVHQLVLQI